MERFVQEIALFAPAVLFNIYFALASIPLGFVLAIFLALGKASANPCRSCTGRHRCRSWNKPLPMTRSSACLS